MNWIKGEPAYSGDYLCAVVNYALPIVLFWNGSQWWGDYIDQTYDGEPVSERFDNNKVLYYMSLSDIPMPEGWQ
jgi:hypothetical protein